MADVIILRDKDGQIVGMGEKGRRAWAKFCRLMDALEVGETMKFSYALPRSGVHHRFFFAKMTGLLERQEQFDTLEDLLQWLKVGAGHVDFMPGARGELIAMPRTINWLNLEEQDFIEFHRAVNDFLWTPHAMQYLWPHLPYERQALCIDHWHRDYERGRPPAPKAKPLALAAPIEPAREAIA